MLDNRAVIFTHLGLAEDFTELYQASVAALPQEPASKRRLHMERLRRAANRAAAAAKRIDLGDFHMTELEQLRAGVTALNADHAILRSLTACGYRVDEARWNEAAVLFVRDAELPPLKVAPPPPAQQPGVTPAVVAQNAGCSSASACR